MQRRSRVKELTGWGALVGLALVVTGCAGDLSWPTEIPQNALDPAGRVAREQDVLWSWVFPIAVTVFILVQGALLYIVFKFRQKPDAPDEIPPQVAGNTRLEMLWTVVPLLILVCIGVPMVTTIFSQAEAPEESERIDVTVVGKQYWWQFEYPDAGVFTANELHIPTATPVYLHLDGSPTYVDEAGNESAEQTPLVLHSFWVPRLAGKLDYVPGHDRFLTIEADEPGTYLGQCAEFCGLSHANMRFTVVAHEPDDYEEWLANQQVPLGAEEPSDALAATGYEVIGGVCITCHNVGGHPNNGNARLGPDLTHFGSREVFAGGIFANDDADALREWIRNAPSVKPGSQMPSFTDLTDEELDGVVEYLQSLR